MASKYERLEDHLRREKLNSDSKTVSLSFKQIEAIIGAPLPRSAYDYQAWWANQVSNHPQTKSWLSAGYKVQSVNQHRTSGSVVFERK